MTHADPRTERITVIPAVLVRDGQLVAAVEEERLRRIKHCAGFPRQAIRECLRLGGASAADVDIFAPAQSPCAPVARRSFPAAAPAEAIPSAIARTTHAAAPAAVDDRRPLGLDERFVRPRMRFVEHHPCIWRVGRWSVLRRSRGVRHRRLPATSQHRGPAQGRSLILIDAFFPHHWAVLSRAHPVSRLSQYGDEFAMVLLRMRAALCGRAAFGAPTKDGVRAGSVALQPLVRWRFMTGRTASPARPGDAETRDPAGPGEEPDQRLDGRRSDRSLAPAGARGSGSMY